MKMINGEWTQKHQHIAISWVVKGAWKHIRQQEQMNAVKNDICKRCGKEESEYHCLYFCLAHDRLRPEIPRASGATCTKHQHERACFW